ncbi:MAG TPA: hypothetical protein VEL31_28735, partial [Ktedonobacteraceae bacterium]|nr:hypothetical protein [Ktedonobacteraceae bacterium]
ATTSPTSTPSLPKSQKGKGFLLLVEGYRMPEYWMYLEAPAQATLGDLDKLLRNTWLECCGHLSAFEIAGVSYSSDAEMASGWGSGDKSMKIKLDKALEPGMKFSHEYDFGTTTELSLKVFSERESEVKGKSIRILARNEAPVILCQSCGKPATEVCSQCVYDGEGWLCEECAEDHECGEEMFLPVVNSPRVGMCGYTG